MAPAIPTRRIQRAAFSTFGWATLNPPVADSNRPRNGHGPRGLSGAATGRGRVDAPDPDAQRLWTPEPKPYDIDSDKYAAWGRKHFGEDWYQQRSIMLEERDIRVRVDPVYMARQKALQDMEKERETGRLPPSSTGSYIGRGRVREWTWHGSQGAWRWVRGQRRWAHRPNCWVSNDVPPQVCYEDNDKNLVHEGRSGRENMEVYRRREEELATLSRIKFWPPSYRLTSSEYIRRKRHLDRKWEYGWSQEQIDAEDQANPKEVQRQVQEEEERKRPPKDQEEMNLKFFQWNYQGFSREEQEQLGRMHGFPGPAPVSRAEESDSWFSQL